VVLLLYGANCGTAFAVVIFTLTEVSSCEMGDSFPTICQKCGQRAAVPVADGTRVDENVLQLSVRCPVCAHVWIMRALNPPFALRRKIDRRTGGEQRSD